MPLLAKLCFATHSRNAMPEHADPFLRSRYDSMWSAARARITSGDVEIDPLLTRKQDDLRRGMTLLIRPAPEIRACIAAFLDRLRALEPAQYYYDPAEFHVTFLAVFSATEKWQPAFARTLDFRQAIAAAAKSIHPFTLHFEGLTASPAAIVLQGFTDSAALNAARDHLRAELRARGLTESLDTRYRLETAHLTAVRFTQPLRDSRAFAQALDEARTQNFGTMTVDTLDLVQNDWYMSHDRTELFEKFNCGGGRSLP
jgi:2'-5' RNA ligase